VPWYGTLIVFVVVWWCVFFMALPVGVRPVDRAEPGHDPGSPNRQGLGAKVAVTTGLALALTALIWLSSDRGWVDWRAFVTAEPRP
jgi:predicted secreted protein